MIYFDDNDQDWRNTDDFSNKYYNNGSCGSISVSRIKVSYDSHKALVEEAIRTNASTPIDLGRKKKFTLYSQRDMKISRNKKEEKLDTYQEDLRPRFEFKKKGDKWITIENKKREK